MYGTVLSWPSAEMSAVYYKKIRLKAAVGQVGDLIVTDFLEKGKNFTYFYRVCFSLTNWFFSLRQELLKLILPKQLIKRTKLYDIEWLKILFVVT
jgi:hypothetical protein